jgi:NADH:ubiquinone reductase (H+-translocating)
VATVFGVRFSGFIAWLLWRGAYLAMLPRFDRKIRVFLQWTLDVCFARDPVQLLTAQSAHSGRLEELMQSARQADAAEAGGREERAPTL